ncbi:unnamed protein product [Ceratitis capitata]|uniref:(Mediterranean fruit fly) hypothetical protein n=2 Tax=Ceratitis capitata TaxID=7213 RepID=A0A811VEN1_CERCA|nr:unnamed protein product [Ceratitis capitata]
MFRALRLLNSAVKRTGTEIQFSAFTKFGNWINLINYCMLSTESSGKKEKEAPDTKTTRTLPKQYKFISVGHILLDYTARLPANEIDILHKFHIPYNTKGELDVQTLRKLKDEACRK